MKSLCLETGKIYLPLINDEIKMIPFDLNTFYGLRKEFKEIAIKMMKGIGHAGGTAFFTIHGKFLKKNETLRRGGAHTDGNYEPYVMDFGGGGWKVLEDGPPIGSLTHQRQYNSKNGGIVIVSNYESCLGWSGEYNGLPNSGGDCSHISLSNEFILSRNTVYYGNNHFIHESLPVDRDIHRVMARITLPENHVYNEKIYKNFSEKNLRHS